MKINLFFITLLVCNYLFSQTATIKNNKTSKNVSVSSTEIGANGFQFEISDTDINTKYSEIGSGFFRGKFIMVSSKKIGGFAKKDPNTNEAYKDLFCLDTLGNGILSNPILFSRILNTSDSENQISFSPDENTVYYTRSTKENSLEFKLYKANLKKGSQGDWIEEELLNINQSNVSIENPFVNSLGKKLYFSANYSNSIGGFDIYVADILSDGTLSTPKNLGNTINTTLDDKYPSLSIDNKHLFFSSKGHKNIGGFDVFTSRISNTNYATPKNLGNTINTEHDEIAYFLANKNNGYFSTNSNKDNRLDIYAFFTKHINQSIKGTVLDIETKINLPNTLVVLKDENQIEIDRLLTGEDGAYAFDVSPFNNYIISTSKSDFKNDSFYFRADKNIETTYNKNLEITATAPIIAKVNNELRLIVENIYFDFSKYNIKEESYISLNRIAEFLNKHPKIKLAINAHTDNVDTDASNLKLSKQRAKSALKYLTEKGIAKNRLLSKGYGEKKPLIDCKNNCSDENLQTNRRIEFVILNDSPENTVNIANIVGDYHIIAGSFRLKKNYIKKIEQLKKEGFINARKIGMNENSLYMVAYASYESKSEALKALKAIRIINNQKAWLKFKKTD